MKLTNSRGSGFDLLSTEMTKYGPTELHSITTIILNESIQHNIDIEIGFGLLNATQKPCKKKKVVDENELDIIKYILHN